MKRVLFAFAVIFPAAVVFSQTTACKKEETAATGSASASAAAASASGAASLTALTSASAADSTPVAPTADPDKLPAPTAAATQAAQSVSTANYKTELDSIEKELNGIK